MTPLCLVER